MDRDLFWHYPHYHAGGDSPYSAIRAGKWKQRAQAAEARLDYMPGSVFAGEVDYVYPVLDPETRTVRVRRPPKTKMSIGTPAGSSQSSQITGH